jgi:hypothetical protein
MTVQERICPLCGTTFSAEAPEGLCTRCLMEQGLGFLVDDSTNSASSGEGFERSRSIVNWAAEEMPGRYTHVGRVG